MHKRILLLIASVLGAFSLGNTQTVSAQAGYAVITPQGSSASSLTAVATIFTDAPAVGLLQVDLPPSPLLASGVLPVTIGSITATGTALALVNRSLTPAAVS